MYEGCRFTRNLKKTSPALVKNAEDLFRARRASLEANLALQTSEIRLNVEQVTEIKIRLQNNRKRLTLAREQVNIGKRLLANKLSNRYEQIDRLKEANSLQSKMDEDTAALKRSQTAISKAKKQRKKVQSDYNETVQSELSSSRQSLEEFRTRAGRFQDNLERTVLRAPVTGTVKRLYVATEGGVVRAGDTIMEIVPADDLLIVEAQLAPQDIGHVRIGQSAFVQLDSPDSTRLGKVNGKVKHISPDSLITSEGVAYYVVHIEVEKPYFGEGDKRIMLFPGMIVITGIVLGKRSVLDYILSPFIKHSTFIFTEP